MLAHYVTTHVNDPKLKSEIWAHLTSLLSVGFEQPLHAEGRLDNIENSTGHDAQVSIQQNQFTSEEFDGSFTYLEPPLKNPDMCSPPSTDVLNYDLEFYNQPHSPYIQLEEIAPSGIDWENFMDEQILDFDHCLDVSERQSALSDVENGYASNNSSTAQILDSQSEDISINISLKTAIHNTMLPQIPEFLDASFKSYTSNETLRDSLRRAYLDNTFEIQECDRARILQLILEYVTPGNLIDLESQNFNLAKESLINGSDCPAILAFFQHMVLNDHYQTVKDRINLSIIYQFFDSLVDNKRVELSSNKVRNRDHHRGHSALDQVLYEMISDDQQRARLRAYLKKGKILNMISQSVGGNNIILSLLPMTEVEPSLSIKFEETRLPSKWSKVKNKIKPKEYVNIYGVEY
jgi:hypothetical protein